MAIDICSTAPGTAMPLTFKRSATEKCSPTPNISRITPTSESCMAIPMSAEGPGVCPPHKMPAHKYPTRAGNLSFSAM